MLVWQDMAGFTEQPAKFVKQFADVAGALRGAAEEFGREVRAGSYPTAEHAYS